ncbi:aspartic peptidase domain-containing protein [Bisporella sp. PMI_857]|nr:aspartic peptidase domain-containing protein [Bisporella sp. PMI_857]
MRSMRCNVGILILTLVSCIRARTVTTESFFNKKRAKTSEVIPAPVIVPPSQYFDGVDGEWSTFFVRIGTPAQVVRVIASTNSPDTIVVRPQGCLAAVLPNGVPSNCVTSRGGTFNSNLSATWSGQGWFGLNGGQYGFEANLGYKFNLDYGLDTLGLGQQPEGSPTLQNQTVAGFNLPKPLYVGLLGLGTQPIIYDNFGNVSVDSYFVSLRNQSLIPSLSWSYTAGARYEFSAGQYAQLIFGGHDTSRYQPNSVKFALDADVTRDIVVGIQSIFYNGEATVPLLNEPVYSFIESTDPNIWLPLSSCLLFEKTFGLVYDNTTKKYLLNETQYTTLSAANPSITFRLAATIAGGATVDIKLPFAAFGLKAKYPFIANDTYYFPLQRADNATQYTLGRTFLQYAYLTVDYERGNFSVSQATFVQGAESQVHPILSPTYKTGPSNSIASPVNKATGEKKISVGPIVGGVIGGITLLAIVGGLLFWCLRRKKKQQEKRESRLPDYNTTTPVGVPLEELKKSDGSKILGVESDAGSFFKKSAPSIYTVQSPHEPNAELPVHQHERFGELAADGPEIYRHGELPADGHEIHQLSAESNTVEIGNTNSGVRYELESPMPIELAGDDTFRSATPRMAERHLSPIGHSNSVGSVSSTSDLLGRRAPSPVLRGGTTSSNLTRGGSSRTVNSRGGPSSPTVSPIVSPFASPRIRDFSSLHGAP